MLVFPCNGSNYSCNHPDDECGEYSYIIEYIYVYLVPIIVVFGLFGNLTASLIFLTTKLKRRSSSIYLGALSLADSGFLLVLLIVHLSYANIIDVYNINILCQIFVFISSTCSNFSVWLIVAFTAERFLVVKYPLKRPQICTVSRARTITAFILIISTLSQIYIFWTSGIVDMNGTEECEMRPEYGYVMEIINYVDTVVSLIIPLVFIVVFNVLIVRYLIRFREKLQDSAMEESAKESFSKIVRKDVDINLSNLDSRAGTSNECSSQSCRLSTVHYRRSVMMIKCQRSVTKMLLVISTVFILLNVPSYALRLYVFALHSVLDRSPPSTLWCLQQIAMTLFYINYSVNFLLYSLCGATFRQTVLFYFKNKYRRIKSVLKYCFRKF